MGSSYFNKALQWATESKRTVKADYCKIKKQTSIDVFIKSFSESMPQIYRRIRMLKCDLKWHWRSPVNLLRFLRTPFPKNKYGGLLLKIKHPFHKATAGQSLLAFPVLSNWNK